MIGTIDRFSYKDENGKLRKKSVEKLKSDVEDMRCVRSKF